KLRAGEHFDDVIEKALSEAKCVIVMWSDRAVQSRYVRDEATYALDRKKLVPVAIENVILLLGLGDSKHRVCSVGMAQKMPRSFAGLSRTSDQLSVAQCLKPGGRPTRRTESV